MIAKLAARYFMTVIKKEKERSGLTTMVLTIIISIFLLISLIFATLTLPFQKIKEFFNGNEISAVEELQIAHGYLQKVDKESLDYKNGSNMEYSNLIFTNGSTDVVYFNQLDSRWANKMYGDYSTIGEAGCGPTAMSIVLSTLTGKTFDPVYMCNWSREHDQYVNGQGSKHSLIRDLATSFGLNIEDNTNNPQQIVDALSSGKLVVAIMGKGHFTKYGHFIVLRGVTSNGKILIADPASKTRSETEWDLDLILNETNKNAGAGGPLWIIGNV